MCHFFGHLYLTVNIATLFFLYIFVKNKFYKDECFKIILNNLETDIISYIDLSYYKTDNSLNIGYVEEYNNKDIKIYKKDIYKWKNKYINIQRTQDKNKIINYPKLFGTEINGNLIGLKISLDSKVNSTVNDKICFSKYCHKTCAYCDFDLSYKIIDNDTINNLFIYNDINVEINGRNENFPDDNLVYLIGIYQMENINIDISKAKNFSKLYDRLLISIFYLNILFRVIKFLLLCFWKSDELSYLFNIIFPVFHGVILVLFIIIKVISDDYTFLNKKIKTIILISIIIEGVALLFSFLNIYNLFDREPNCICIFCNNESSNQEMKESIKKKNKIKNDIEEIKMLMENGKQILENNKKILDDIILEIKKINSHKEEITYNLYIKYENEYNAKIIESPSEEKEKLNEIYNKRKKELIELKRLYSKEIPSSLSKILKQEKLKLNLIYFDKSLNGFDDYSGSYEFFKILKNSIDGVFFGIKTVKDFVYLKYQLSEKEKIFILIFSGNDSDKNFLKVYHSFFSHIIILTFDKNEIKELNKLNNIYTNETNYINLYQSLKKLNLNISFNRKKYEKYMATPLNLYSEYINNNNIIKCHLELLDHTFLKKDLNNENNLNLKGLTENEFSDFKYFFQ